MVGIKLLVSPVDEVEAEAAVSGGADIIDVKNPREGSLGANFPWMIQGVGSLLPSGVELSATIGDLDFKPGSASLAAYGLARLGVDYVKAGLFGISDDAEAREMASSLKRSLEGFDCKLVIAGYADFSSIGSISPLLLPEICSDVGAEVVMIDTAIKNGSSLLDHLGLDDLCVFVNNSHDLGLQVALAGSLGIGEVESLRDLGVDIVGVRGAVCSGNDRLNGRISSEKVRGLKDLLSA